MVATTADITEWLHSPHQVFGYALDPMEVT
jgi:hypothetical protein